MSARPERDDRRRDEDPETPRPGFVARQALRAVDGGIGWLQHIRLRFDPRGDGDRDAGAGRPSNHSVAADGEAKGEPPPRRSFILRGLMVGIVCLACGGAGGGFWAYRQFDKRIAEHSEAVERLQAEIDSAAKSETRATNLMARFQRENAEMRLQLREAQTADAEQKARIEELDRQLAAARQASKPPPAPPVSPAAPSRRPSSAGTVPPATATPRQPTKTGNCAVGGTGSAGQITDCIEQFNRR